MMSMRILRILRMMVDDGNVDCNGGADDNEILMIILQFTCETQIVR